MRYFLPIQKRQKNKIYQQNYKQMNLYNKNSTRFEEGKDPEKSAPENPMEKMMGGMMFEKKFIEQRKIFLWGAVDEKSAKDITNRLLYLDAIDPGKEIAFYINSPGGGVTDGMVIYDTMKMIKSPVSTICMGMAASMGSILLSGGEKGKRFIFPHAEVMIHQPSGGGQGTSADLEIIAVQILKAKQLGAKILAENCGQTYDKVIEDFDRDYWMNATESKKYGIVDAVINKL